MPYATRRNQPELNKAYAHVVSKRFGDTALKLQDALIDMGFERDETLSAIVGEQGDFFPLEPFRQPLIQTLAARPDLSDLTDDQRSKITITEEEGEFRLVALAPLPERVATQLRELAPAAIQLDLAHRIALHNLEWSPSPSEQGLLFSVPQLAVELGATFRLFDPSVLEEDFELDLNEYPADLAGFSLSALSWQVPAGAKAVRTSPDRRREWTEEGLSTGLASRQHAKERVFVFVPCRLLRALAVSWHLSVCKALLSATR